MLDGPQRFDIAVGIVGLLTFPTVIAALIYSQLPCTRLRELEQLSSETEGLLHKEFEAGLLGGGDIASQLQGRLNLLKRDIEEVRVESHCATTYMQNVKKMFEGLSRRISSLCDDVKKLRADISTTSARERERLRQSEHTQAARTDNTSTPSSSSQLALDLDNFQTPAALTGFEHTPSDETTQHAPPVRVKTPTFPHSLSDSGEVTSSHNTIPGSSSKSPAKQALITSTDPATSAEGSSNLVVPPGILDGDHGSPSLSTHGLFLCDKGKAHRRSRVAVLLRLVRSKPSRKHSSFRSTRGLLLVPSQTLASIELAGDNDDPEWEDVAVRKVLPV